MSKLQELIQETKRISEDAKEAANRARSKKNKRQQKNVEQFFNEINAYLVELQDLKK
ncbi:hypothetical protein INR75_02930 [Zunongwangia sp. SCSIO 43204]|uniref:hypothetical protein n=1 Tax=Zunongwangia sp. SCSIO 43204 TaxID=2779359 RepID=UPI001CA82FF3|nr:hypothetical protein [Zunongwangia sp. SCSIO 43204]UAB85001.1 hypothetical protein INR75_02930 [Zunongwangia sp. SCSIO 43204]